MPLILQKHETYTSSSLLFKKKSSFACIRGQDTAKDGKGMSFAEAINNVETLPHIGHWKM